MLRLIFFYSSYPGYVHINVSPSQRDIYMLNDTICPKKVSPNNIGLPWSKGPLKGFRVYELSHVGVIFVFYSFHSESQIG